MQSDILWHRTNIYGPKVFLLTKIKPEYSDILYNPTHFPGPLVCRIIQVLTSCTFWPISLVPWYVELDRFYCINLLILMFFQDLDCIFDVLDPDERGELDYSIYMRGVIGEMEESRKNLVRKVNIPKSN